MFTPAHDSLQELGLGAEEGLVEVEGDHNLFLVLQNPSDVTVRLQEEGLLGELQPVKESSAMLGLHEQAGSLVGQLSTQGKDRTGRVKQLYEILDMDQSQLTLVELTQLQQLLEDYEDIFAMDDCKTNVTYHSIDTGNHLFILRKKIEEMVAEMEEKGVG